MGIDRITNQSTSGDKEHEIKNPHEKWQNIGSE